MEAMLLGPHCTLGHVLGFSQGKAELTMLSLMELCLKYLNVNLYNSVSVKYSILLGPNKVSSQNEFTCTLGKET